MKAHLMYSDRDFISDTTAAPGEQDLIQDLGLGTLFDTMAGGDTFLRNVAIEAVLTSLRTPTEIIYRQHILADCIENPAVVTDIYTLVVSTLKIEKGLFGGLIHYPSSILHYSIDALEKFVDALRKLRQLAGENAPRFRSDGFTTLFAMLAQELDDDYFDAIDDHLRRLQFRHGVLISARLGTGNKGTDYTLRKSIEEPHHWWNLFPSNGKAAFSFRLADRDESGAKALADLRGTGINLVANALAESTDHILSFFQMLHTELAFYIGCLNLHQHLSSNGEPLCFPKPAVPGDPTFHCDGIYDVVLALSSGEPVVGNNVDADGKPLVMITGANQGGKSTLLRAIGQAQLMMQCGMIVCAASLTSSICTGLFTHYKREEDTTMTSGKLDEELARMSEIANHLIPDSLVLFNESFASTNEREGSEIARQIIRTLIENQIRVVFVTHLYDLAHSLHRDNRTDALFLRAERNTDGSRPFQLVEGEPLPTSFGPDLYQHVFGAAL